jgi:hypothetical protein
MAQFRHLGTTVTNQNFIQWEIKRRLNSGNACYHSVHNLLSSRLLSKTEIRIYKTIILPVVVYGYETLSLILREEHRLRVFQDTVLRRIFGPKRDAVTGGRRRLYNEELHNLYSSPNGMIKSRKMSWAGHLARMGRTGMHIGYWWEARRKETTRKTKA